MVKSPTQATQEPGAIHGASLVPAGATWCGLAKVPRRPRGSLVPAWCQPGATERPLAKVPRRPHGSLVPAWCHRAPTRKRPTQATREPGARLVPWCQPASLVPRGAHRQVPPTQATREPGASLVPRGGHKQVPKSHVGSNFEHPPVRYYGVGMRC